MLQSPRGLVVDGLVAVAVALLGLAELTGVVPGSLFPATTGVSVLFILLSAAPLVVRRRYPMAAFLAVVVVTTVWQYSVYTVDQQPPFEPFVAILVAVFGAGALTEGRTAAAALATVGVGVTLSVADIVFGQPLGIAIPPLVMILGVFALGRLTALYRRRAHESALRAVRAEQSAERSKQEAIASERARIARELHDVVSHDVSLMVLQASVERRLLGESPDGTAAGTAAVLQSIESAGRDALTELRHMLGVLRQDAHAPLAPQPGLDRLEELVAVARTAGVDVEVHRSGEGALPPGLELAAYRVLQESLTNVVKHVGPTHVRLWLDHRPEEITIDVLDDGPAAGGSRSPLPGGHGLLGMRERVQLYGGTLRAGPHEAGFRVQVRLPVPSGTSA
jgi:signal transduction histidine kinase